MMERSGARIIIRGKGSVRENTQAQPHPDDNEPLHVAIDGAEESVARAVAEVEAILFDPRYREEMKNAQLNVLGVHDSQELSTLSRGLGANWMVTPSIPKQGETTFECRIPNSLVGLVIGRGGENIKRIAAELGVRIQIAKEAEPQDISPPQEPPMRRIALTGSERGIDRARNEIEDILRSKPGASLNGSAESIALKIPNDKVGLVIGKAGTTIRSIQERTGVTVKVPPAADADDPNSRTLELCADTQQQIHVAKNEIDQLIADEIARASGALPPSSEIFPCPEGCVGLIIGKGGETIHKIQNATGIRIQIPPSPDPNSNPPMRMLGIIGSPQARQQAIFEISQLVAQHEARHGKTVGYESVGPPPDPYANPGFVDPYAPDGIYDPTYAQQQLSWTYAQEQAWTPQQEFVQEKPSAPHTAINGDQQQTEYKPEDYINDFWNYAGWYGEEAARLYYGDYAPPLGTPPPPHIQLPPPGAEPGNQYYADEYAQQFQPTDAALSLSTGAAAPPPA